MFDYMDGVIQALAMKKTWSKEDLYFDVKFVCQKLSPYYTDVTLTAGKCLISEHILDHFQQLWSFRKWEKRMDINPEHGTSYTTQY